MVDAQARQDAGFAQAHGGVVEVVKRRELKPLVVEPNVIALVVVLYELGHLQERDPMVALSFDSHAPPGNSEVAVIPSTSRYHVFISSMRLVKKLLWWKWAYLISRLPPSMRSGCARLSAMVLLLLSPGVSGERRLGERKIERRGRDLGHRPPQQGAFANPLAALFVAASGGRGSSEVRARDA